MNYVRRVSVRAAVQAKVARDNQNQEAARAALIRDGYLTRSGELSPAYGGPQPQKRTERLRRAECRA